LDKKIEGGDKLVRKTKNAEQNLSIPANRTEGKSKLGLSCIGEICFTDDGFQITIPENADPECAKRTADLILAGNSKVVFNVPGKGIVKTKEELEKAL